MPRCIALVLVVVVANGCTRVTAFTADDQARLAAEDAVIGALLADTKVAFGDTLALAPTRVESRAYEWCRARDAHPYSLLPLLTERFSS